MTINDMHLKTSMQDIETWNMQEKDTAYLLGLGKSHMISSRTIRNLLWEF